MKKSISRNILIKDPLMPPILRQLSGRHTRQSQAHSIRSVDPFDNMKHNKNANPSLRPVLSKHNRSPIFIPKSRVSSSLTLQKELKVCNSQIMMPKNVKILNENQSIQLLQQRVVGNKENLLHSREVLTPFFNSRLANRRDIINSRRFAEKGYFKDTDIEAQMSQRLQIREVSFGESDYMNPFTFKPFNDL